MKSLKPGLRHLAMLLCFLSSGVTLADEARILELTDGSVISGQIVSFDNGVFTIESPILGRLRVKDSEILSLRPKSSPSRLMQSSPQVPNNSHGQPSLSSLENQILANPEILSLVMSLQQDPQILAILNDPAIMQAIAARDVQSLRNNPKIQQLEGNPTIQRILRRLNQ